MACYDFMHVGLCQYYGCPMLHLEMLPRVVRPFLRCGLVQMVTNGVICHVHGDMLVAVRQPCRAPGVPSRICRRPRHSWCQGSTAHLAPPPGTNNYGASKNIKARHSDHQADPEVWPCLQELQGCGEANHPRSHHSHPLTTLGPLRHLHFTHSPTGLLRSSQASKLPSVPGHLWSHDRTSITGP